MMKILMFSLLLAGCEATYPSIGGSVPKKYPMYEGDSRYRSATALEHIYEELKLFRQECSCVCEKTK